VPKNGIKLGDHAVGSLDFLDSSEYQIYNRRLAGHLHSINAAIFLSELINREKYHRERKDTFLQNDGKDWFFYTIEKGVERLAMSRKEQDTAIKILEKHKFIKKTQKGLPAKRYFWVNEEEILSLYGLQKKSPSLSRGGKLDVTNSTNCTVEKGQTTPLKKDPGHNNIKNPNKNPKKETSRNCVALSEASFRLVDLLSSLILENCPKAKNPDRDKWARDIDRMNRIDGYSFEEIETLIRFSQQDEFWQGNILSTAKLRKQATQLSLKMKKSDFKTQKAKKEEKNYDEMKEFAKYWVNKSPPGTAFYYSEKVVLKINGDIHQLFYSENGFKEQLKNGMRKLGVAR